MKKKIGYILFALLYRIGCIFKADDNKYFCVMTHDGSEESSVGVVISAIKRRNVNAEFVCIKKENKTKQAALDFMFVKPFMMAKAKTILLDNEFLPMAYIKFRKNVKVVQLWHGTGTVKKFGHDICSGNMLKLVKRADSKITHLIVNSQYTRELYANVFDVERDKVYVTGIPRADMLFDSKRLREAEESFFEKYPELRNKKLVLYAPTFRDDEVDNPQIMIDLDKWIEKTDKDTVLMLRLHPFVAARCPRLDSGIYESRIINMSDFENLNTLMSVAEILITDYSSIIFEYIVFNRPILFYAYDLDKFEGDGRGFYEDYISYVPGAVYTDIDDIIEEINSEDRFERKRKKFFEQSYEYKDGKSTERLLDLILDGGTYETVNK